MYVPVGAEVPQVVASHLSAIVLSRPDRLVRGTYAVPPLIASRVDRASVR